MQAQSSANFDDSPLHPHATRMFNLSCIALIVTAMTFAIRAGILNELGEQYAFSNEQLGIIAGMAFFGFPVAMIFGGLLYNHVGAKKMIWLAFICHFVGLVMTIFSSSFIGLLLSTFLVGFANGAVEAGCNPLISDLYRNNKTTMLNKFHVWFPGGIVIGALVSYVMTNMGFTWEYQIAVMLLPTAVYGVMLIGCTFPDMAQAKDALGSTVTNIKSLFSPIFIFLIICMTITATTELGTQQWINSLLGASGAHPMLVLAMITGIMAVGRYFAGPLVHTFNPTGVLLVSAVLSTLGMFLMTQLSGGSVYAAAIVFAIGVTYFWPTIIGCVAEYQPQTGALGMSLIGGAGMFAVSIWNPIIGGWIDDAQAEAAAQNLSGDALTIASGQAVLANLVLLPAILIVLFAGFYIYMKKTNKAQIAAPSS
ncbi:sugar MFS transporter [Glaciecola sp. SC05]|uniref:MFS transporter n=1 Tax=Glaciecola sp. SC05 TaxID=1987355 RepID=UPI0035276B1E